MRQKLTKVLAESKEQKTEFGGDKEENGSKSNGSETYSSFKLRSY